MSPQKTGCIPSPHHTRDPQHFLLSRVRNQACSEAHRHPGSSRCPLGKASLSPRDLGWAVRSEGLPDGWSCCHCPHEASELPVPSAASRADRRGALGEELGESWLAACVDPGQGGTHSVFLPTRQRPSCFCVNIMQLPPVLCD